jgi:hypothetical protein
MHFLYAGVDWGGSAAWAEVLITNARYNKTASYFFQLGINRPVATATLSVLSYNI